MTDQSSVTEAVRARRAETPAAEGPPAFGASVLAVIALAWLAAMMWSSHAEITSGEGTLAITSAAMSLPTVISAGLVAGAAASLAVGHLLRRLRTPLRFAASVGAGLAVGVIAALVVISSYGGGEASTVLAGTLAAAVTAGGALAAVRARAVAGAIVAAGLVVFAVEQVLDNFQPHLMSLYGSKDDPSSRLSASGWSALTIAVCTGLAAGLVAYFYLRRAARRAGEEAVAPKWPAYAIAGAGPGLLLGAAEFIIRTLGADVLALAGSVSEADATAQQMMDSSRVNNALVVLFVGAIVAIIMFGRTMPKRTA
ncbi:hypothetical protein [Phytohabitans houttuyneae]|uniref:Uncharacterized protein n=1 Tax=Phytohabitans houttuyneae TaxID=1076126 RepID=A0A6V8KLG9_9ACTN|nr:hypothetical protein [Phytohabitans houttuyneae]GFJ84704.1 hypothetical protein Phou_088840 [Phytohabitans houttuyneae]